jgi:hypothetical protein
MQVACRSRLPRARSYLMVVRGSAWEAASWTSRSGTPASSSAVMNACRSVCRPTGLLIPAWCATRRTIAYWLYDRKGQPIRLTHGATTARPCRTALGTMIRSQSRCSARAFDGVSWASAAVVRVRLIGALMRR